MAWKGYGQFCPVARGAEIVAERWTPLILRELLCGSTRFSDLRRGLPGISPTLLASRLKVLASEGLVRVGEEGYALTPAGEALRPVIEALGMWGKRWTRSELRPEELDAGLLMWDMQRRMDVEALPPGRVVVFLRFRNVPRGPGAGWFVLDRPQVDLCLRDPGFDVDLWVEADLEAFTRLWMGELTFAEALQKRVLAVEGPERLGRAFPRWMRLSMFAGI